MNMNMNQNHICTYLNVFVFKNLSTHHTLVLIYSYSIGAIVIRIFINLCLLFFFQNFRKCVAIVLLLRSFKISYPECFGFIYLLCFSLGIPLEIFCACFLFVKDNIL